VHAIAGQSAAAGERLQRKERAGPGVRGLSPGGSPLCLCASDWGGTAQRPPGSTGVTETQCPAGPMIPDKQKMAQSGGWWEPGRDNGPRVAVTLWLAVWRVPGVRNCAFVGNVACTTRNSEVRECLLRGHPQQHTGAPPQGPRPVESPRARVQIIPAAIRAIRARLLGRHGDTAGKVRPRTNGQRSRSAP